MRFCNLYSIVGQLAIAYTLFIADKLIYFDEKLCYVPIFRGFFYAVLAILIFVFWSLGYILLPKESPLDLAMSKDFPKGPGTPQI